MDADCATERTISLDTLQSVLDVASRPDPYSVLAGFPRGVSRVEGHPIVVVTSYEHAVEVLRSPVFSVDRAHASVPTNAECPRFVREPVPGIPAELLFLDPPAHTVRRKAAIAPFRPGVVADFVPTMQEFIDDRIDGVARRGCFDVIADIAGPVGMLTICALMGIPLSAEAVLREWAVPLARVLDPIVPESSPGRFDPDELHSALIAQHEFLTDLVARRTAQPRDDLMSDLIRAAQAGKVGADEVVPNSNLLLIAGQETTVNLVANAYLQLLRSGLRPDLDAFLDEVLRFDPPVQLVPRIATEDVVLGGVSVGKGEVVVVLIAAANRDEAEFSDGDVFDPNRSARSLAFGLGAHYCLGAPLAKVEARLVLQRLGQRVVEPRLLFEPTYRDAITLRGPREILVGFDAILDRTVPWD